MSTTAPFAPTIEDVPLPLTRLTAEEYIAAVEGGAFDDGRRVELIEGFIVDMSPSGSNHTHLVMNLTELFAPLIQTFRLGVQATLRVGDMQVFDPDFMLLIRKEGGYRNALPRPKDVRLLVEVAESSFPVDSKVKLSSYATAGIEDYLIVDVEREVLLVHRLPQGKAYAEVQELSAGDQIAPLAAPDFTLEVASVFA